MKALTTRVGTYVTSDGVADAVAEYALALTREHDVDAVELSYVADDGRDGRVRLVIGWGADLDVVSYPQSGSAVSEPEAIAEFQSRTDALHSRGDAPLSVEEAAALGQIGDW